MDLFLVIAAFLSLSSAMGHIVMGSKLFLKPVLESNCDEVPKKVFHGLFHLMTVSFFLYTLVLVAAAFSINVGLELSPIVLLIGVSYVLWSLAEVIIAVTSGINGALKKMFVWIFFILTGGFTLLGYFL